MTTILDKKTMLLLQLLNEVRGTPMAKAIMNQLNKERLQNYEKQNGKLNLN